MSELRKELVTNFVKFEADWPAELGKARVRLAPTRPILEESYVRISTVQAWRAMTSPRMGDESAAFFFEAQNDFLISHCLASCGSFRQALKALRSAIENCLFALYYMDHPVELQKWLMGNHRLSFVDLMGYFEGHPRVSGTVAISGLPQLRSEYATLSKAVHGSAKLFRMTDSTLSVRLWSDAAASVSKWATREREAVVALNMLLAHLFQSELVGAKHLGLRTSMGLVLPAARRAQLKSKLGINVVAP